MKFIYALFWTIVGIIGGGFSGAVFGYYGDSASLVNSAAIWAAISAVLGFVYGILTPTVPRDTDAVIEQYNQLRYVMRPCAWCDGSGSKGRKKSLKPCRACDGSGNLLVKKPVQLCPGCKGKGRTLLRRRCKQCQGTGWQSYARLESPAAGALLTQARPTSLEKKKIK